MTFGWHSCAVVVLAGLIVSNAAQINSSTTCSGDCQTLVLNAASFEAEQHASPSVDNSSFYKVPSNFSTDLPPGTVLHVEQATNLSNYTVPSSLTMSRIIYTTVDLNGRILPTSAYILWPYTRLQGTTDQEGFPMVAWAHGTSGVFRECAPSNYRSLQYHFMAPYLLAMQGMAVVAPDYAGLGINTLPSGEHFGHPWLNGPAQANDLANAIVAARSAFPGQLRSAGPFVTLGHSQGGSASWSFAELMVNKSMAGYKGAVAIAPPTRTIALLEQALALSANASQQPPPWTAVIIGAQPKLIDAVTALYPAYNHSGLTSLSADRWFNVFAPLQACLPTDALAFADVPVSQLARPGWTNDVAVQNYSARAETGRKQFKGPLLVVAGDADLIVPHFAVESAVDDTCRTMVGGGNESLEMVTYTDMNHFPVIQASEMKWLGWVKDRLTGKPLGQQASGSESGCVKTVVEGYRTNFTVQSLAPNFLVEWASPMEGWKYAL